MEYAERVAQLKLVFTPARPVQSQDLFAGRREQLLQVLDTLDSPGEHAAIYGERGVGKTSLASVSEAAASLSGQFPLRLNCMAGDTPKQVWRRVGSTISRRLEMERVLGNDVSGLEPIAIRSAELLSQAENVQDALTALEVLSHARPVVIFLDEFDRLEGREVRSNLVDLMKTVADLGIDVRFVIVGVAGTVDGLIDEHRSIGRGLNEIEMPRMSSKELAEILSRGYATAEMEIQPQTAATITRLSMGLPHYTHLLGLHAGVWAAAGVIEDARPKVDQDDLMQALPKAVSRAQAHVSRLYHDATHSTQANIFREVLLGAAVCKTDERGYFAPGDLRQAISHLVGKPMPIPSFSRHLVAFATERGPVLEKSGQLNRPRYRFSEPLLVPYVAMRGITDKLITLEDLAKTLA